MPHFSVQKTIKIFQFWAVLILSPLVFSACTESKKPKPSPISEDGQCLVPPESHLIDHVIDASISNCRGKSSPSSPILYAHYLEQTLKDDICFDDLLNNKEGALNCAPGPVLNDKAHANQMAWELSKSPDYLVWHLDNHSPAKESFYITDQNGFPIRSQSIKLENQGDSIIILLPKANLIVGKKYYIYLVLETKDNSETWIQTVKVIHPSSITEAS